MSVKPKDIRDARTYLNKKGIRTGDIAPRHFAAVAAETGKSFRDTLNFIARLLSGGQGLGPSPSTTKHVDLLKPENAIGGEPIDYAGQAK